MGKVKKGTKYAGDVQVRDNLESMIAISNGETNKIYRVLDGEEVVGQLDMLDLVKALVPRISSTKS